MKRREFIAAFGCAVAWPLAARAQRSGRVPVVGVLWHAENEERGERLFGYMRQAFADLGYTPGKNIIFEDRFGGENPERYAEHAAELVRLKVDAILTDIVPTTIAAQKATSTIPIVFMVGDPLRQKIVPSLAHPAGNATGFSYMHFDLDSKRLQIFKDAVPNLSRVGLLVNPDLKFAMEREVEEYRAAAASKGVTIQIFEARNEGELKSAFSRMAQFRLDGLIIGHFTLFDTLKSEIAKMTLDAKLPAMGGWSFWAEAGALLSYSALFPQLYRDQAAYVKRILAGEKAGELPVQQPTKFELVLNMKTANALGISIPHSFILLADRVIE